MQLPGEVSIATSWHSGEVSRGHSTCGKRGANRYRIGSHKQGRTERKEVLNGQKNRKIALANENRLKQN